MHPKHPMRDGTPPPWASGYGVDEYGPFALFTVGTVTQGMRWVPPGLFTMGSPINELGRYDREIQHQVELTKGYWMADTPVTQALWVEIMGRNPSRFVSPERPVERVSWHDTQAFIKALNTRIEDLNIRLPTEAEWECACRAGTTTATYAGEIEILGRNNVPVLDDIAWYVGNSGQDFDLKNGEDSSGWVEKQYPHTRAGTHPVGLKAPNALGLYDMLGNVWEWCADWHGKYSGDGVNPSGPKRGTDRIIRGGSWNYIVTNVRAAHRDWRVPGLRYDYLGLRLSQDSE